MKQKWLLLICILVSMLSVSGQKGRNNDAIPENNDCLKCHKQAVYSTFSVDGKKHMKMSMAESCVIAAAKYKDAIHGSFKCVECHSEGYSTTPHPIDLKFEPMQACTDCHGGRKKFARYHLDSIVAEYDKSVHAKAMTNTFTCWKCHNAHTYVNAFSDQTDLKAAITISNESCLNCHNNAVNYNRVSDKKPTNLLASHQWLIHPELHMQNIRCVDCHAKLNSTTFTPHEILPASKAVRDCSACHSEKSMLSLSLFRTKKGNESLLNFTNNKALEYAFIMGANRSIVLNYISTILFILVLLTIFTHMFFMIRYRKLHKNG